MKGTEIKEIIWDYIVEQSTKALECCKDSKIPPFEIVVQAEFDKFIEELEDEFDAVGLSCKVGF